MIRSLVAVSLLATWTGVAGCGADLKTNSTVNPVHEPNPDDNPPRPKAGEEWVKDLAQLPGEVPDSLPDAAARRTAIKNLQTIVRGIRDFTDKARFLPAGVVANRAVGLSWRVQILPYIGEDKLYKEFKLTEPWDGEHNKKLLDKMPAVFASVGKKAEKGHTFLRTTQGPGGLIVMTRNPRREPVVLVPPDAQDGSPVRGVALAGIPDGLSQTVLVLEAGQAVPWTKPEEYYLPSFNETARRKGGGPTAIELNPPGGVFADGFHAAMVDGRITFFKNGYRQSVLAMLFCPHDGFVIGSYERAKVPYSIPPQPRKAIKDRRERDGK